MGGHDHVIIGSVSPDAWRAHEQAHLKMALAAHQHDQHLIAFLQSLTDERFVNDPRYSNPFVEN